MIVERHQEQYISISLISKVLFRVIWSHGNYKLITIVKTIENVVPCTQFIDEPQ